MTCRNKNMDDIMMEISKLVDAINKVQDEPDLGIVWLEVEFPKETKL